MKDEKIAKELRETAQLLVDNMHRIFEKLPDIEKFEQEDFENDLKVYQSIREVYKYYTVRSDWEKFPNCTFIWEV